MMVSKTAAETKERLDQAEATSSILSIVFDGDISSSYYTALPVTSTWHQMPTTVIRLMGNHFIVNCMSIWARIVQNKTSKWKSQNTLDFKPATSKQKHEVW